MSYRRRHRWFRRMVLGLAFSVAVFAGRTSVAAAKFDEGVSGTRYVSAGGWSGEVDMDSGVPVSAGIPEGDEQFIDPQAVQVVPYLSHGILSEADAQAAAAEAIHDPFLTDVFVQPGESLGGPDGDQIAMRNALGAQAAADAQGIHDPYLTDVFVRPGEAQGGPDGRSAEQWAVVPYLSHGVLGESVKTAPLNRVERALQETLAAESIPDPNLGRLDGDQVAVANAIESRRYIPGVTDFPTATVDTPAVRPDDVADRFAHSDVPAQPEVASSSSSSGTTVEWNEALTAGIAVLVLGLGLGLALGRFNRPKLAGL